MSRRWLFPPDELYICEWWMCVCVCLCRNRVPHTPDGAEIGARLAHAGKSLDLQRARWRSFPARDFTKFQVPFPRGPAEASGTGYVCFATRDGEGGGEGGKQREEKEKCKGITDAAFRNQFTGVLPRESPVSGDTFVRFSSTFSPRARRGAFSDTEIRGAGMEVLISISST